MGLNILIVIVLFICSEGSTKEFWQIEVQREKNIFLKRFRKGWCLSAKTISSSFFGLSISSCENLMFLWLRAYLCDYDFNHILVCRRSSVQITMMYVRRWLWNVLGHSDAYMLKGRRTSWLQNCSSTLMVRNWYFVLDHCYSTTSGSCCQISWRSFTLRTSYFQ